MARKEAYAHASGVIASDLFLIYTYRFTIEILRTELYKELCIQICRVKIQRGLVIEKELH